MEGLWWWLIRQRILTLLCELGYFRNFIVSAVSLTRWVLVFCSSGWSITSFCSTSVFFFWLEVFIDERFVKKWIFFLIFIFCGRLFIDNLFFGKDVSPYICYKRFFTDERFVNKFVFFFLKFFYQRIVRLPKCILLYFNILLETFCRRPIIFMGDFCQWTNH